MLNDKEIKKIVDEIRNESIKMSYILQFFIDSDKPIIDKDCKVTHKQIQEKCKEYRNYIIAMYNSYMVFDYMKNKDIKIEAEFVKIFDQIKSEMKTRAGKIKQAEDNEREKKAN